MMSRVLYYLLLWPLSRLPLGVLHALSTGIFYVLYYVVGYRKAVVMGNLRRSFPDKTPAEVDAIAEGFYRHLCDLVVESIRMFAMSEADFRRQTHLTNPEFVRKLEAAGRSVILVAGHYNSWEMLGTAYPLYTTMKVDALYAPLRDKFMNGIMSASRGKFGMGLVPKQQAVQMFEGNKGIPTLYLFGADQSPSSSKNSFWMDFLNQDTAVAFGAEKYAKEYDCSVVFGNIQKIKRGHYSMTLSMITDNPRAEEHGYITRRHTQLLEDIIRQEPRYWLWTHKRWKRKREG